MTQKEILKIVAQYIKEEMYDESTGHDWWHIKRVYELAMKINKTEQQNGFIIGMVALLHDIYDDKFSSVDTREQLIELLKKLQIYEQIEEKDMENIIYSVENLGFKGGFNDREISAEGKIVQDADRLDCIGAIGIARVFAYGGKKGLSIYNPEQGIIDINSEQEYREKRRHSINHFYEKLLKLKDIMNTQEGTKIAIERTKFMQGYLKEFFAEWSVLDERENTIKSEQPRRESK